MISTIVWGDGSIARDAIRAVAAHPALDLTAVLVSDRERVGRDAGDLAGLGRALGVAATDDVVAVLATHPGAVVYAGSGRTRSRDAAADVAAGLRAGAVVVTPPIHPLHDHRATTPALRAEIRAAVADGGGRLYLGDVDPDWANHVLPVVLGGLDPGARSIHCREVVDYSAHALPGSVRYLMGMGEPLTFVPPMLAPRMPTMVWGDRVRLLARALGVELDEIRETVERVQIEVSVETDTMGKFEAGGQGAVRFEVQGMVGGEPRVVVEHVGRIHPECAPEWPAVPAGASVYRIVVEGDPRVEVTIEPGPRDGTAAGPRDGTAVAVDRLVDAIEALADLPPGGYDEWALRTREPLWPRDGPKGLTGAAGAE